jgi:hypothetical protein
MEVHTHTHTARKKWTHYFWEFFMLFLAVTLGFFVENQREHLIEHKRANAFAASMLNDLKDDTANLRSLEKRYRYAASNIDTFLLLVENNNIEKIPGGKLYWYGLWGGFINPFVPNDATFQEMKSSGSLRYIQNRELAHKIALYDQQVRKIQMMVAQDGPVYIETRKARARIFDFRYNKAANEMVQVMYKAWANESTFNTGPVDSFLATSPPLLTYDKTVLNEYIEFCRSRALGRLAESLTILHMLAIEIINELKTEYHLK